MIKSFLKKVLHSWGKPKTVEDWLDRYNLTGDLDRLIAKKLEWTTKTPLSYHIEYEGSTQLSHLWALKIPGVQVSLMIEYSGKVNTYDIERTVQVRAIMVDYLKYPEFKFYGIAGNGESEGLTFIVTEHWVK